MWQNELFSGQFDHILLYIKNLGLNGKKWGFFKECQDNLSLICSVHFKNKWYVTAKLIDNTLARHSYKTDGVLNID